MFSLSILSENLFSYTRENMSLIINLEVNHMLGSRLKELCIKQRISQQKLADLIGVNRTTIGKYELKNVRPSYEVLEKICRILNTTPEYLSGSASSYPLHKENPPELINFIREADYTLYGSPISQKDKRHLSKIIEILYYDNDNREKGE